MQLTEANRKLAEAHSELKRSDKDAMGIRDQLRDELRKSEGENQQLRERCEMIQGGFSKMTSDLLQPA